VRKAFAFSLTLLFAVHAFAGNAGSAYTMFGIGDLRYYPSARSAGMGYTGIGLPSPNYINSMMPAAWSRISRVRIEANALYEGINTAETNKSLYQARGLFNGVMLAIPISSANGIVFVGGFSPYSFVRYNTSFSNSQNGVDYRINEIGSGGLTKAQVGLSYSPIEDVSFGASLNYMFGKFTVERAFQPSTAGASGATLFIDEENSGLNFTLSGMYNGLGKLSEALRPVSLGFFVTTQSNLNFDLSNRIVFASEADTFGTAQKELAIPVAFGVGAAYQLSDRWLFAADFYTQAWSNARYDGLPLLNIRNNNRFGIGAEKLPLKDASKWLDKLAYRLGFSYNATYYKIYGEPINEWAVTGGFTMPVSGETRLNVGIEYAERGVKKVSLVNNTSVNLVKDNIIRLSFSLNIVEPWFVRYEEE
jgi:hypothetical protein